MVDLNGRVRNNNKYIEQYMGKTRKTNGKTEQDNTIYKVRHKQITQIYKRNKV